MIKKLFGVLCAMIVSGIFNISGATVSRQQVGEYGHDDLVMENEFLKIVIAPYSGGRIKSFIYKPTQNDGTIWLDSSGGMLRDVSPSVPHPGELGSRAYQYTILKQGEGKAIVELWRDSGIGLRYRKTLTLEDGKCRLKVELACENPGYGSYTMDWRLHNFVRPLSENTSTDSYLVPTEKGIKNKTDGKFTTDVTDGWVAALNSKQQGLACIFPYDQTAKQYIWMPNGKNKATIEWFSSLFKLGPGDIWQAQTVFAPFENMPSVKQVLPDAIFDSEVKGGNAKLKIFAFADGTCLISMTGLPSGEVKRSVILKAGKPCEISFNVPANISAPLSFRTETPEGSTQWTDASPGVLLPAVTAKAKNPPAIMKKNMETRQITSEKNEKRQNDPAKIRILQLSQFFSQKRPHEELDQEDFLPRIVFRGIDGMQYFLKNDARFEIDTATERNWLDKIVNLYSYDVLVINDFMGTELKPYVKDILKYVEKGHGLVILGGYNAFGSRGKEYSNYKEIEALLPVKLLSSPDWKIQPFEDKLLSEKKHHPVFKNGTLGKCNICHEKNIWLSPDSYPIQPDHDFSWIKNGNTLTAVDFLHPVIAGIPLNTLAPDYHVITEKEGTSVIARIGKNPVIVGMNWGKGKILASGISDYRRLYFWPYTAQLYGQMLTWSANKKEAFIIAAKSEGRNSQVRVLNNSQEPIEGILKIKIQAPDNTFVRNNDEKISLLPGEKYASHVPLPEEAIFPGEYKVSALFNGKSAETYIPGPENSADIKIAMHFKHKIRFARGETIQPEITIPGQSTYEVTCRLVDNKGQEVFKTEKTAIMGGKTFQMPVSSDKLAYGEYKYVVTAKATDGKHSLSHAEWIYIGKKKHIDFPIAWYGIPGYGSDYMSIAGIDMLSESCNMTFGPKVYKIHAYDIADYSLEADMQELPFMFNMARTKAPDGPEGSPNYPGNVAEQEKRLRGILEKYKAFPAISYIYIGDEEASFGRTEFDVQEFKKKYNCEFPALPKNEEEKKLNMSYETQILPQSLSERIMLADYQTDSLTQCYQRGADIIHSIRPDWQAVMILTFGTTPVSGNWIERTFSGMDAIFMDVYPCTVSDIGESLFYLNVLRTASERQKKRVFSALGEYRNDLQSCKMQFWLALMTNMKGLYWFSIGGAEEMNGIRSHKFKQLSKYNMFAKDYAPLFAAWTRPEYKAAVLYSKAVLCKHSREPFESIMEKTFEKLYSKDITPDIVTENDIRNGTAEKYDVIVLSGIDELENDIIEKLSDIAIKKEVYFDEKTKVSVRNSKPFDLQAIARQVTPIVKTADEHVYGEFCCGGTDINYVTLYNHNDSATNANVKVSVPRITAAYDIRTHERIPFIKNSSGIELNVPLDAYDGRIIAVMTNDINGIKTTGSSHEITAGENLNVTVEITPGISGLLPVKMLVVDPDGKATRYSENFVIKNTKYSVTIQTAINDLKGTWKIIATEMVSGKTGATTFAIK